MPGYIGKVLARRIAKKELIIVPSNYRLYSEISKEVQTVFAQYDTNFSMMSLDEAYLDFTHHMSLRPDMSRFQKSVVETYCPECSVKRKKLEEFKKILKNTEKSPDNPESPDQNLRHEKDQKLLDDQFVTSISDQKENFDSNVENEEHQNIKDEILKIEEDFRTRSCSYCWRKYFKDDINGAVEEMRYKVFKLTRLTCSGKVLSEKKFKIRVII